VNPDLSISPDSAATLYITTIIWFEPAFVKKKFPTIPTGYLPLIFSDCVIPDDTRRDENVEIARLDGTIQSG